jgi:hypothetical protein
MMLPPEQQNSFAWYGPDMALNTDRWMTVFTPAEIEELEAAAHFANSTGKKIIEIIPADFPLPTLEAKISALRNEMIHGCGFALLRGLPVEKYSEEMASTIFYGFGAHLGLPRKQNAQGHLLGHVRDMGLSSNDPNVRVYQTSERQTFHTDSCDVVGLMCLKTARSGGLFMLVSSSTIFNEMRKRRPDLLELLFEPIATDRRGEVPEGMLPYFRIPVFSYYQGFLTSIYQRQYIDSAQRFPDAPRLTDKHIEALDLFDELANSEELNFSMKFEPGDMQFLYNHTLLHDRTAFDDWPEEEKKRHHLRLWLTIPGDRPLPEIFNERITDRLPA